MAPLALFLSAALAAPVPVTSAAGQVGRDVITSRKVQISTFIDRWSLLPPEKRVAVSAGEVEQWSIKPVGDEFKAQLSSLMLEMMVAAESEGFESTPRQVGEFRATAERLQKELGGAPAWRKLEVEAKELEALLLVKERAKGFLKVKMESGDGRVPEAELRAAYEQQKAKLGGLSYEEVKNVLRDRLSQQAQLDRLKDWIEILKRKYRVQYFGSAGQ